MQHFYVWNFNKRKRIIAIFILAVCITLVLVFKPTQVFQVFSKAKETALTKGNANEKKLALTFNISWGEEKVHDILKALKKNHTQATFFVSGEWAERHPQIIEAITEDQHEIGMMGYRYKNYLEQDIDQVRKDMTYAKEIFKKLGLDNVTYIRPPTGHFKKEIIQLAESMGLEVIHWSVNPKDWKNPGVDHIKKHIQNEAGAGDIILLHASDSAKQTAEVLQTIIPAYEKEKLKFVTISELLHEVTLEERLVE